MRLTTDADSFSIRAMPFLSVGCDTGPRSWSRSWPLSWTRALGELKFLNLAIERSLADPEQLSRLLAIPTS